MCLFQETCLQAHIKNLKDSYWTVRVQTQVYTLITDQELHKENLLVLLKHSHIRIGVSGVMGYQTISLS